METKPAQPATAAPNRAAWLFAASAIALVIGLMPLLSDDPKLVRAGIVAGVCLALWLTEVVPLYTTTLLLWVGIVTLLGPLDPGRFSLPRVLSAAANPVVALFFGGFALSAAASTRHGIDTYLAAGMVRVSRGHRLGLFAAVMAGTTVLSMWMSNIAAAAMMFATLRPLFTITRPGEGEKMPQMRRPIYPTRGSARLCCSASRSLPTSAGWGRRSERGPTSSRSGRSQTGLAFDLWTGCYSGSRSRR